jgi:hypothetical protein
VSDSFTKLVNFVKKYSDYFRIDSIRLKFVAYEIKVFLRPHILIVDLQKIGHKYSNMKTCLKSTSINFNLPSCNRLLVLFSNSR